MSAHTVTVIKMFHKAPVYLSAVKNQINKCLGLKLETVENSQALKIAHEFITTGESRNMIFEKNNAIFIVLLGAVIEDAAVDKLTLALPAFAYEISRFHHMQISSKL